MSSAPATWTALGIADPHQGDRTGEGVGVAVLDSGVNLDNPHLAGVASTSTLESSRSSSSGSPGVDEIDRLGHGTAVAAAIQEKAPGASLHAVKIFHDTLSTDAATLVRALDRALEHDVRLINLSLGTAEVGHGETLGRVVERAIGRGAIVVSPREHRGRRWWPGSLPGVVGVLLDWSCPRHELRLGRGPEGEPVFRASGLPRPVPGVSPARNLSGISFAVANVSGILARLLEDEPGLRTVEDVAARIEALGVPRISTRRR